VLAGGLMQIGGVWTCFEVVRNIGGVCSCYMFSRAIVYFYDRMSNLFIVDLEVCSVSCHSKYRLRLRLITPRSLVR
jgi:hypothetical protein